jgi:hypothetical protein
VSQPDPGLLTALLLSAGCGAEPGPPAPLPSAAPPAAALAPAVLPIAPDAASSARPLPRFRHSCRDRRYPALAGDWIVGCGPAGLLDLAEHIPTGRLVTLDSPAESAGLAPGQILAVGDEERLWVLPSPTPLPTKGRSGDAIAPPASWGPGLAVLLQGQVSVGTTGDHARRIREAQPLPWYPPAMSWPTVYWVDGRGGGQTGMDIWGWTPSAGPPVPVVVQAGDQRHPVASATHLAWTDEEGIWLQELEHGQRWLHAAEVGFRAGPSIHEGTLCWEERRQGDVDVRCTDGLAAQGPGYQGWPSRYGPWLLIRRDGIPWLITKDPQEAPRP